MSLPSDAQSGVPRDLSVKTGFSAISELKDLPHYLCRGITLRMLLRSFGKVIRIRPDSLPEEQQAKLHELSEKVTRLQFFLSHCWASSGVKKYLSLIVHFLFAWAFLAGVLSSGSLHMLQQFELVELPVFARDDDQWFGASWYVSHWEFYAGMGACWGTLFFGHLLCSKTAGFLDCACIHQTDPVKKMESISHLPSFLSKSENLLILLDPRYFTRGWCAFELGFFMAANPNGKIHLLPIRIYEQMWLIHVYLAFSLAAFLLIWPALPGLIGFEIINYICLMVPCAFTALASENNMREFKELKRQMRCFDIRTANVKMERDRMTILSTINSMYTGGIDEFNSMVQEVIHDRLVDGLTHPRTVVPYHMLLLASFPLIPFFLSCESSVRHQPILWQFAHYIFDYTVVFAAWPTVMVICMRLGIYMAPDEAETPALPSNPDGADAALLDEPESAALASLLGFRWRHVAVGLFGALLVIAVDTFMYLVPCGIVSGAMPWLSTTAWHGPALSAAQSVIYVAMAAYLFWPCPLHKHPDGGPHLHPLPMGISMSTVLGSSPRHLDLDEHDLPQHSPRLFEGAV